MSAILKLLSKFDDSGINKAKKSFGGLKTALGAVGIGFGLKAITDELAQAVKNAQADVISQKQLARQLKITTNATNEQVAAQEDYISKLSMTTGVVDDQLRPAFSILLRATGSVTKAQDLLGLSLDTSAGTGKNLEIVTKSIARAYNGNITGLQRLVPGIKKGSDAMAFLRTQFAGARETLANPFDKLQIAIDETKEKIGMILLPYIQKFATYIIEKVVPNVEKFLDDVSNPKTEAGKMFLQVKDAVAQTIEAVKTFFGYFGDGDATKGFANVASSLVKALPALLALKGIMMLASAGKSISGLAKAIGLIKGAPVAGVPAGVAGAAGGAVLMNVASVAITSQAATLTAASIAQEGINKQLAGRNQQALVVGSTFTGTQAIPFTRSRDMREALFGIKRQPTTVVNVNVQNADPKATVDAVSKYVKQNGGLPGAWGTVRP